jgi:hypothetical protein
MSKFLLIPVTSLGNVLVSATDIKGISQASVTTTTITYSGGKVLTITHATITSGTIFRDIIQDAVVAILKDNWTNVTKDVIPAYAVSSINIA